VIRYDATTGPVLDMLLAGLTNTPALNDLPALSARLGQRPDQMEDGPQGRG